MYSERFDPAPPPSHENSPCYPYHNPPLPEFFSFKLKITCYPILTVHIHSCSHVVECTEGTLGPRICKMLDYTGNSSGLVGATFNVQSTRQRWIKAIFKSFFSEVFDPSLTVKILPTSPIRPTQGKEKKIQWGSYFAIWRWYHHYIHIKKNVY